MLKLKERIKYYAERDYFDIGAAGIAKVKQTNKYFHISRNNYSYNSILSNIKFVNKLLQT